MEKLIQYLNEMAKLGLISGYSLGGDTALIYYFEPFQTQDVDVFVLLKQGEGSLINLSPIYSFLSDRGVDANGEYVMIDGVPVQFLVPYNELVEEAVSKAQQVNFRSVEVPIPPLEYLMAIMVQTNRPKDRARIEELLKQNELFDSSLFNALINKFNLNEKYQRIKNLLESQN